MHDGFCSPAGRNGSGGGEEAGNGVSVLDVSSTPATDEDKIANGWVKIDKTNFPDDDFRKIVQYGDAGSFNSAALQNQYPTVKINQDNDDWLSPDEIAAVKAINFRGYIGTYRIKNLTGIGHFTALEFLDCSFAQELTELDVSKNKALTYLNCDAVWLTKLDVSNNTALTRLVCSNNQLTELDVSKNTALKELRCNGNRLTKLQLTKPDAGNNTALTYLDCEYNDSLEKLDVSKNTALTYLNCSTTGLTELNVSNNTALTHLICHSNLLTSLDLGNTNVRHDSSQCDQFHYIIEVDPENRFNLQDLPGSFNINKASNWIGGRVDGMTLTVYEGVNKVKYTYDCGTSKAGEHFSAMVTLYVRGDNADPVDPDIPADGGDTDDAADNIKGALSAIVVGAVAGAIVYEAGTGIYRAINMPGFAMPSNRGELAMLLWEHAGKPEPVITALYGDITEDDIDLNKAARWAVEQGLMQDDADSNKFNLRFPVSKLRTCLTWNAAKEKGLFDTDKPAE